MEYGIMALICLTASTLGAICGIGGGVILKPVLDAMGVMPVETISFLSGITVLCMSGYSVSSSVAKHEFTHLKKTGLVLSLGAAFGGVIGKLLFERMKNMLADTQQIGSVQAMVLFWLTLGTLLYTLKKNRIHTKNVESLSVSVGAGILLGVLSSFLGIGGGPFNLIVLSYLFSMDTKEAARTSLFIIMCSQLCSLGMTICQNSVPDFSLPVLGIMAVMGIGGGIIGRVLNRKMDNRTVDQLFRGMVCVILIICIYNFMKYR